MNEKTIELLPDPKRVIEGLRDTGYQFEAAMADIIDNSIGACATTIKVQMDMEVDGKITISIADNGKGMNNDDLINAMKYGSQTRSCSLSLGKFGLGLKTASTAFCRKLSVITRDGKTPGYLKATWDLDFVAHLGKWVLKVSDATPEEIERLKQAAGEGSGTLVLWEEVDRLIKHYNEPNIRQAQIALNNSAKRLMDKLQMTYQRFLDPNYLGTPKVELSINDEKLEAWDPFVLQESEMVGQKSLEIEHPDDGTVMGNIKVTAYVLPRREDFSSNELAKQARISNDYQGVYVYRENRLICGPDWFGLYTKDPHFSLIRVDFSFGHELDDAFHIDIKKSQVILNEALTDWLEETFLPAPRRAAEQKYRKGIRNIIADQSKNMHISSNKALASKAPMLSESKVTTVGKDQVDITNKEGTVRIRLKTSQPATPEEIYVKPVESIDDGLLWEPTVMNNKVAVAINTGHAYYSKVYIPNKNSSVIIQGLDSLLWALTEAEVETINEQSQGYFREMRYHLSKILRELVKDLPEPETEE